MAAEDHGTTHVGTVGSGSPDRDSTDGRAAELLRESVEYLHKSGLEGFSLANLAAALGTSSRMLIYHLGPKDQLLARVQTVMRKELVDSMRARQFDRLSDAVEETWNYYVARLPHLELFIHLVSRSFEEPAAFREFSGTAVAVWAQFFEEVAVREGYSQTEAEAMGRLALAGFRGLILDLAISGELRRVSKSMAAFTAMLNETARAGLEDSR